MPLNPQPETGIATAVARLLAAVLTWLLSLELSDVQTLISIFSGLAVLVYSVLQIKVLWRDKFKGARP